MTINPTDYPLLRDAHPTEAHARYYRENGHATYKIDGRDTGICPRCGEVTETPAPTFSPSPALQRVQGAADRLAELVDAYAEADAEEKAAADRKKDLRDQLLEIQADLGGQDELTGTRSAVKVSTTSGWRLDTTRLKREQPAWWAAYAVETSTTRLKVSPR